MAATVTTGGTFSSLARSTIGIIAVSRAIDFSMTFLIFHFLSLSDFWPVLLHIVFI